MARPALHGPGRKHAHDDFEEIWVEVMHQEQLDQTIRRLDAEIERDESRAKTTATSAQAAKRGPAKSPAASIPAKPRPRRSRSRTRVRPERARKEDEPGPPGRTSHAAGLILTFYIAFWLTVAGAIVTIVVRLVRIRR